MAVRISHRLLVASTLLLTAAAGGCADEQETLVVLYATAWPGADDCSVGAGNAGQILNNGTLDSSFGTGMVVPLVLANQQARRNATTNSGIDTTEVQLKDVDVSISVPQAPEIEDALNAQNEAFLEFTAPLQSISIPGGSQQGVIVDVLTAPAVIALDAELNARFDPKTQVTLVADITINAERSGNTRGNIGIISARTFTYPIVACSGCLVDCSSCEGGVCPDDGSGFSGGVCGNAQDFALVPNSCSM